MKGSKISECFNVQIFTPCFFSSFVRFFSEEKFSNFILYNCNLKFFIIEI